MRVTIFGSGYVGLVTGACLAEAGNHVICVDVDSKKIERLNQGEVPIHEPGLETLIMRNAAAGRIEFTTDAAKGVEHGLFRSGLVPVSSASADADAGARRVGRRTPRHAHPKRGKNSRPRTGLFY